MASKNFQVPVVEEQGFEADDLIASLAVKIRNAGGTVVIAS